MITQEQYDSLNDGDTVTARYESLRGVEDFEATGKVYVLSGMKFLAGRNLLPGAGAHRWTIIEHIPATPAWHSAQVISAMEHDNERLVYVRPPRREGLWLCARGWYAQTEGLADVKILVDKDVEL